MKTVAIIAAMDKELTFLFDFVKEYSILKVGPRTVYKARYREIDLYITKCGIGKVNGAMTTTIMINVFNPDLVINTGIAGGVDKSLRTLDVVIADRCAYSDVDCRFEDDCDLVCNQVQGEPLYFPCSNLLKVILETKKVSFPCYSGTIITSDKFIKNREQLDNVVDTYDSDSKVLACDMESAAIAQVCHQYHKDVVIVRAVSDVVGETTVDEYRDLSVEASRYATEIISLILSKL